jgi:hypothetical protein
VNLSLVQLVVVLVGSITTTRQANYVSELRGAVGVLNPYLGLERVMSAANTLARLIANSQFMIEEGMPQQEQHFSRPATI